MQFKYPELLWALLLLVIPIIIHLFQLRRFRKTPFTNVKLLKKVVSESRKSSSIKKWLLLFTRLGLVAAIVIAFAQPFKADAIALQDKENVFYLDNSFSMQAKTQGGTLLQSVVQNFIKNIPVEERFTLFTNDKVFANVAIPDIKNELLQLPVSTNQLTIEEILLAAETFFKNEAGTSKNTILISDFQTRMGPIPTDSLLEANIHYVQQPLMPPNNVAIDSIYLSTTDTNSTELTANLSSSYPLETTAISLYNGDKLIAKTAAKFNQNQKASVRFSVDSNTLLIGKVVLTDKGLAYDNQFYFNINTPEKLKVLAIGTSDVDYLSKIFTNPEFSFSTNSLAQLNYATLENYNLVVLNELETIPTSLTTAIKSYTKNGGNIILIPALDIDIASYNQLTTAYANTRYTAKINQEIAVSNVIFDHPIYKNVFEKRVTDFQYPKVNNYFSISTKNPTALGLQNNAPFLIGIENAYFFTASLSQNNSNFKNSPLIVPTFYNMGINSLKLPQLYNTLGEPTTVEIPISLSKDNILTLVKGTEAFIPQQRLLPKKVALTFKENPTTDGTFKIENNGALLKNISFNYNRAESVLSYLSLENIPANRVYKTVPSFFEETQKTNSINEFWKWFAILALLFVFLETVLLRLLK
ncbi:MAG: hypothetical protein ACJAWH_001990 [Maribacter sp.]|jgi:hypothetical protein